MNGPIQNERIPVSSMADTLDAGPGGAEPPPATSRPQIDLVEGVCQGLSIETNQLLAHRLRIASLVLGGGFGLFLVWSMINYARGEPIDRMVLIHLAIVTVVLTGCGLSLCRRCTIASGPLRLKELIVFGLPAAFLMQLQYLKMVRCATAGQELMPPTAPWLLLMFTYALFIPNSWRRAAVILGCITAAPLLVILYVWLTHEASCMALNSNPSFTIEVGLMMGICYTTSVLGVKTIGTLRREAFAARQLGHYQLKTKIGAGGMGEVYLAEHQLMKRPCAIKIIRPERAGDSTVLSRFAREVQATAQLSHWNSIDIYDYGRAPDGTFYYVMEYLPGMCLEHLVEGYGPLPAGRAVFLLRQACDALREAHEMEIIHRDIKPANLFAAQRGGKHDVAKLLDFGLAKPMVNSSVELTQDGHITGSPHYMSPEQAMGEQDLDARSDIYSIGAVAYFLVTGRPPFDEQTVMKVLLAHAHQRPKPPREWAAVPEDFEAVIMKCLEKQPEQRYQSVNELIAALDECRSAADWSFEAAARWWSQHAPLPQC